MLVLRLGLASSLGMVVLGACGGGHTAGSGAGGAGTGPDAGDTNCYSTSSSLGVPLTDEQTTRVCGSDGKIYPTECDQAAAGVSHAASGCSIPQDSFACEYCVCKKDTEYCVHPVLYNHECFCSALPAACAPTPSCDCVKDESCGAACTIGSNGEIIVQCNHG
jgi:hypothetical protein